MAAIELPSTAWFRSAKLISSKREKKLKGINFQRKKLNAKNGSVVLKYLRYFQQLCGPNAHVAYHRSARENGRVKNNSYATLQKRQPIKYTYTQFSFWSKRNEAQRQWKMLTTMFCSANDSVLRALLSRYNMHKWMHMRNGSTALSYVEHTWTCSLTDRPSQAGPTFSHFTEKMPRNENHCRFTLNYFLKIILQHFQRAAATAARVCVHSQAHYTHYIYSCLCLRRRWIFRQNELTRFYFLRCFDAIFSAPHTYWSQNELAVFISQPVGSSLNYISIQKESSGMRVRETQFAECRNQAK